MENLGKNEQRRMKAHIADLERQLDQAQANAYNLKSPVHTICNENLKEALAAALEQMTRADAAEAELDQLALLDEKQCSNVYSELIDLLHIHAKGSVIEAVTDLQAKLADAGDGSCDHCGCVPAIVMPTSLCDECRDGVKRAEIAEAKLAALEALCRDYITNLDAGYDVLASHATDRIREAINPPAKGAANGK